MFVRNQMPEPIRGVLAPVVTPFRADLSPDRQRFIRHCQWLLSHNCGLAVFGTNSEANSMSAEERMALLDALVAAGIDPSRMMPGTGCCSITGMKDSSGDWNNTKTFLDAFVVRTARAARTFDVFVGSESFLLANMRNGGAGTISATANVNPAAIHKLYKEWNTADDTDQQQSKLNVVREVFGNRRFPSMIAALKQAIAIYANDPEWTRVRPPLVELTTGEVKLLAADLKAIDFAMPGIDCSRGR